MTESPSTDCPQPSGVTLGLAAVWVAGFFVVFSSFTLLNNPEYSRRAIWSELPGYCFDLLIPSSEPLTIDGRTIETGWSQLPQRFDLLGCAGWILAGAWGLGHLCLRGLRVALPARCAERTTFALAGGLSLVSLLTLGGGLLGIFSQTGFGLLYFAAITAELTLRLRERNTFGQRTSGAHRYPYWQAALMLVMAIFSAAMLLGAMLPSFDFDVNEYHLQGPKEWFLGGRIAFLPHNAYTSFPFLTEMLSLSAMNVRGDWFRGALAGKTLLMAFAPLTALALFCLGRRWFSDTVGWLAAAVYLTTPWVYRVSIIAYTEGALLCFLSVSLLAFDVARERATARHWLLVGFFAGSAMACKYPGLISVVIPIGVAACVGWRRSSRARSNADAAAAPRVGRFFLAAALGLSLSIGPWLLKNFVETGNPVYPLAWTIFGGRDWDAELNQKWRDAHSSKSFSLGELRASLVEVVAKSDYQSPLLFAFAPLAILFSRRRALIGWMWAYIFWLFGTYWLLTHRLDRFWLPIVPVGALLAAVGLAGTGRQLWHWFAGGAFALAATFNLVIVTSAIAGLNQYLADLDALAKIPGVLPSDVAFLNRSIPPDGNVLLVGQANVLYVECDFVYNTVFDRSIFEELCARRKPGVDPPDWELLPADEIRRNFRERGITHVAVNWNEIVRYRTTYRYTDFALPHRFDELVAQGVLSPPARMTLAALAEYDAGRREEIERRLPTRIESIRGQAVFAAHEIYEVAR